MAHGLQAVAGLLFIPGFACDGGAALRESRAVVPDIEPGDPAPGPHVIFRFHACRLVQAAERHLHPISEDFLVHGNRAAALRAEPALRVPRRSVSLGLRADPGEPFKREVHETQARGARVLPAVLAMTDNTAQRRTGRSIPDCTAETPAFKHFGHVRVPRFLSPVDQSTRMQALCVPGTRARRTRPYQFLNPTQSIACP